MSLAGRAANGKSRCTTLAGAWNQALSSHGGTGPGAQTPGGQPYIRQMIAAREIVVGSLRTRVKVPWYSRALDLPPFEAAQRLIIFLPCVSSRAIAGEVATPQSARIYRSQPCSPT